MDPHRLPVVVIGAGPVGLAAAAHLLDRGLTPVLLEAGPRVGANPLAWGTVRMFSPWKYNLDAAAVALLERHGWERPQPDGFPTGRELVERYLEPLADLPELRPCLWLGARVVGITRAGFDKLKSGERDQAPFVLRVRRADGDQELLARAVIDASGTFASPNPLGANGLPAHGESALAEAIAYGIPDVLGAQRARYADRRVLVVGSGHSALNSILDLAQLAGAAPRTAISWAFRRTDPGRLWGGGAKDQLPERGRLGARVRSLVEEGRLSLHPGFLLHSLTRTAEGIVAASTAGILPAVDEVIAATGFRPDLAPLRELRLDLDPVVESPRILAPLIDPNLHSCGTVPPHGVDQLAHPEPGFFIVGMKSYGRAPSFLLMTGYEQVRSVVSALAGDWEAARDVRLVLPETGVCSLAPSGGGAVCCAPDARLPTARSAAGSCCPASARPATASAPACGTGACAVPASAQGTEAAAPAAGGCCG